jgi:tetratricopeptide (TPR) repeat protein
MGNYEAALADFDRAIVLKPENDWLIYDRGLVSLVMNIPDKAQSDFSAAICRATKKYKENPKHWRNTFNLALYYLTSGDTKGSEQLYREVLTAGAVPARNFREAIEDLNDFLHLFSSHRQAQAVRSQLKQHFDTMDKDR